MSPIPGWYPDPAGSPDLRYWDGEVWTSATTPAAQPAPTFAATPAAPPAARPQPMPTNLAGRAGTPSWARTPDLSGGIPSPRSYDYGAYSASLPQRLDTPFKPKNRLSGRMVAAGVAAVAAAAGAVLLLNQHHGGPVRVSAHTTISMPTEVAGLPQLRNAQIDEIDRVLSGAAVPKPHLFGFYGASADSPAAFVMVAKYPQTADQVAHNLSLSLRALDESIGNVTFWQTTDPGALGGQMRCATVVQSAQSATVCMFEDTDVVGLTFSFGTAGTPGPDAVALRDAVEHRS